MGEPTTPEPSTLPNITVLSHRWQDHLVYGRQYWLRQRWPNGPLLQALRNQMRGASLALCWLLEQRPALAAQVALGPELLLDAIRVVACDTATS